MVVSLLVEEVTATPVVVLVLLGWSLVRRSAMRDVGIGMVVVCCNFET